MRGLVAFSTDTPKHSWPEVYTTRFGWIPFDPLQVDLKRAGYAYDRLKNRHIYFSSIRNDPTLLDKYTFWYYRYWGDPIKAADTYVILKIDDTGESASRRFGRPQTEETRNQVQ